MGLVRIAVLSACLLVGSDGPGRSPSPRPTCVCMGINDWVGVRRTASALFSGIVIADSMLHPPFLKSDSLLGGFGSPGRKVTFIVEYAWKLSARTQTDSVLVNVWDEVATSCSVRFSLYERYLVVAVSGGDLIRLVDSVRADGAVTQLSSSAAASLLTNQCMGTQPLARAGRALEQLGPGIPVVDSGRPRPPTQ